MPRPSNLKLIDALGYLDMLQLQQHARIISGGIQKEAYWPGTPCVTLRQETEWIETVQTGWNLVVGAHSERIVQAVNSFLSSSSFPPRPPLYGDGCAAEYIVTYLGELA